MKILHISYIETNAGWGAEWFTDIALEALGHEVIKLDFKKYGKCLAEKMLEIKEFDILFLQRGDYFPIEILKAVNRPKVFWASELISRCVDQNRLFYCGEFDHIFVRGDACKNVLDTKLKKKNLYQEGMTSCLISAFDENTHRNLHLEKTIDVLFIGGMTERRKQILDRLKDKVPLTVCVNIFGEECVRAINQAKIVLNIHSSKNKDTETRIYEVMGCGSFLLTEPLAEENPFVQGKHYVEAEIEYFEEIIKYYLIHGEEREKIAMEGYCEAVNRHSYKMRTRNDICFWLEKCIEQKNYTGDACDKSALISFQKKQNNRIWKLYNLCTVKWLKLMQLLANVKNVR